MQEFTLTPGSLSLKDLKNLQVNNFQLKLNPNYKTKITQAHAMVTDLLAKGEALYGINTGFGKLAKQKISEPKLIELQHNLIFSHAAGCGDLMPVAVVKTMLLLKINALSQGLSGVSLELIEFLIALYNNNIIPCVPSKGSVGASGDLAPLAHMSLVIFGEGEVFFNDQQMLAMDALKACNLTPIELKAKEGLALINGTQASTSLAIGAYFKVLDLMQAALIAGAMSYEGIKGCLKPLDPQIHQARGLKGQIEIAAILRELLENSELCVGKNSKPVRVQDPYSIRCQPQVMGAALEQLKYVKNVLASEINAVTDNPLVFSDSQEIITGGNFHAEPIAMISDALAILIAEIGSLSERRVALMMDPALSLLPPFLVNEAGLNSGFMLAHVTAASLVSENKVFAHPASIDSIPTSGNQEDHVSMATFAARRLFEMADNLANILAIELICAAQAIDLQGQKPSLMLEHYYSHLRSLVKFYAKDRLLAPDLKAIFRSLNKSTFVLPEKMRSNIFITELI